MSHWHSAAVAVREVNLEASQMNLHRQPLEEVYGGLALIHQLEIKKKFHHITFIFHTCDRIISLYTNLYVILPMQGRFRVSLWGRKKKTTTTTGKEFKSLTLWGLKV